MVVLLVFINASNWGTIFNLQREPVLKITFLSIGQGDGFLITTPDGINLLVDGGPDARLVTDLLRSRGVGYLDAVLMTHPDTDHVGGLTLAVQEFNPKVAIYNPWPNGNKSFNSFQEVVATEGIEVLEITSGDNYLLGCCVELLFFWPDSKNAISTNPNDESIGFFLSYLNFDFYSAGDISAKIEERSADYLNIVKLNTKVELLKVGHHGSKTSSSEKFLNSLKPKNAVMQYGKNSYGHPNSEVVDNFSNLGIPTFNTNTTNLILETDGVGYSFEYEN